MGNILVEKIHYILGMIMLDVKSSKDYDKKQYMQEKQYSRLISSNPYEPIPFTLR